MTTATVLPAQLIDEASAWDKAAKALTQVHEVAIDTETDGYHHYQARLCFLQAATENDLFLFDTLSPAANLQALAQPFADPGVVTYIHAASGDLSQLAEASIPVKGLFDTHRAATLLGLPKVGLKDLVLECCGVTLAKEHQQANFSLRPTPPEYLAYIADDVRYLIAVGRWVREACVRADILEEVTLEFERMCAEAVPTAPVPLRIPRAPPHLPKELVAYVARELDRRRHAWASAADIPYGRILSARALEAIVVSLPDDEKTLKQRSGVNSSFLAKHGTEVLELIAQGKKLATQGELPPLPPPPPPKPRAQRAREEHLLDLRKTAAAKRKVAPSVVLTQALVEDLAKANPRTLDELRGIPFLGPKRVELYGKDILTALAQGPR